MKLFNLKLKQKILGVILLVVLTVMIVSSLVISYVTYNQNVETTNANLVVGANNIKAKITEIQEDLVRKVSQMNTVFKVNENVKFIGDFKKDYDLSMTETGFVDLANALFATVTGNNINDMAIYDVNGELVAFSEQQADGQYLVGYYYVNPEKAFKYTRIAHDGDSKKNPWEVNSQVQGVNGGNGLKNSLTRSDMSAAVSNSLGRQGKNLALSISVPVMVDDYNKDTDKMEPKLFGYVLLSKILGKDFVSQMAKLTGLHVNIFAGETLSFGDLSAYSTVSRATISDTVDKSWTLRAQEVLPSILDMDAKKYFQGVLPVYSNEKFTGAIAVLTSNKTVMDNTLQVVYTLVIVYLCCIVLIIPVALFFSGTMVKSILNVTASLKDVAQGEGDLTKRIQIKSKDEIGELSHWFNMFVEKLQVMIADISTSSQALSSSVQVTQKEAGDLSNNSKQMLDITHSVTQSTNEMSSEISSISGVVGQASDNLDIVASSTEEMTATINEIAKNAETARAMSVETGEKIEAASGKVNQLGVDAKEIDGFTESINEISEQTNLLALNATIEAARAGESGKGFAVVAGEIKALATQTANATQDIKLKIDNIMRSASVTVDEMDEISKTFGDMNEVVNEIASAIEEQSATTKEIADNTATVASGISDVNASISQFDGLATEVAGEMDAVNQASSNMSENCTHINGDAEEMGKQTQKLDGLINRFVIE